MTTERDALQAARDTLAAAQSALLSFAHGNASEEFARDQAGNCGKAVAQLDAALAEPAAAQAQQPVALMCLTAQQIKAAYQWAVEPAESDDDLGTEWWFGRREAGPWGDNGETEPAGVVMWLAEYPEEGCLPLDVKATPEAPR